MQRSQEAAITIRLLDALEHYDPSGNYDEVFNQVNARPHGYQSPDKADISVLICWKRIHSGWLDQRLPEQTR